jgi:Flp pilus assembly protein TadD
MTPVRPLLLLAALALASCAHPQRSHDAAREVRRALAAELEQQGSWDAAFQAADALYREDPSDGEALLLRARALRHKGALAEAEADLRQLVGHDERNAAARAELAIILERTLRSEEALAQHREAARLEPGSARYLNNLGFALVFRGRPAEAIPLLEEGLRIAPADPRLRNNLGFACAATGDFARAALQFALGGGGAEAANNLGLAYERAGNLAQAYQLYGEAVRLAPASATARANLESVASRLGRSEPAAPSPPSQEGGS